MTDQQPAADDGVVARPDAGRNALTGAPIDARIRYAKLLSDASLVPVAYRGKPANAFLAVETGTMLGLHPIAAINGINVIEGKPTISPGLMTALVRRAGHKVRVSTTGTVEAGDVTAVAEVIRSDDPDFTYRSTWNLERAARAGLCRVDFRPDDRTYHVVARSSQGKPLPWESYTEAMLKARAIGEVCREAAEDALSGVHYTPEELGAVVGEDGDVIDGEVVEQQPAQQQPAQQADPDPSTIAEGTPLDDELAPLVRDAILDATSEGDLRSAWEACEPHQRSRMAATEVADEDGTAIDALALWIRARDAVKAGTAPLRRRGGEDVIVDDAPDEPGDVIDAEVVEDTPTPKVERGPLPADADPWATPSTGQRDDPIEGDPGYRAALEEHRTELVERYAPGVETAQAVLGGSVVDVVKATPEDEAAANRARPAAAHEDVADDRAERQREHDPARGDAAGRAAFLQARQALKTKAEGKR